MAIIDVIVVYLAFTVELFHKEFCFSYQMCLTRSMLCLHNLIITQLESRDSFARYYWYTTCFAVEQKMIGDVQETFVMLFGVVAFISVIARVEGLKGHDSPLASFMKVKTHDSL